MKINRIFERFDCRLFAVQYAGSDFDALELLEAQWHDAEHLREFFLAFQPDYQKFYGRKKVKTIVKVTMEEADRLLESLLEAAEGDVEALNELFQPLDNREDANSKYDLQKLKAKGAEWKSVLRIYAIRYEGRFVVTGGAIKLTGKMEERKHTKDELKKLELVRKYLASHGIDGEVVYMDS